MLDLDVLGGDVTRQQGLNIFHRLSARQLSVDISEVGIRFQAIDLGGLN